MLAHLKKLDKYEKQILFRYLLRKLSFRPSVDELKTRKVSFPIQKQMYFCYGITLKIKFLEVYDYICLADNQVQRLYILIYLNEIYIKSI